MTGTTESSQTTTPVLSQRLIILILGLCLTGLWIWRAGLIWRPAPNPPQPRFFIDIRGGLPRPGLYTFAAPPTGQEAWEAAGGQGSLPDGSLPLPNGAKILLSADRAITLESMAGQELLTLGLKLDLNSASVADLEAIPGIGPVLAGRIVQAREHRGPFRQIADLLEIPGLGPKILEKVRPYVVIIPHDKNK